MGVVGVVGSGLAALVAWLLQGPEFPLWAVFLEYVRGPGVSVVVGVVLSFVVEYWPQYKHLEPRWKRLVFAGACFVVPLAGTALTCASGLGAWGDFEWLWWPAIWAGGAAFFAGQMTHLRKLPAAPEPLEQREPAGW